MARTLISLLVGVTLLVALTACVGDEESGEHNEGAETGERSEQSEGGELNENSETGEHSEQSESGEHSRNGEGGEHSEGSDSDGDGEESGTQYGLTETYDVVRAGARLILSYDTPSNAFTGTVENTTGETLRACASRFISQTGSNSGQRLPATWIRGRARTLPSPRRRGHLNHGARTRK